MNSEARPRSREDTADAQSISWSNVKVIFEGALELDGPARQLFLERNCGENLALKQEVESLLDNHHETSGFLDEPVVSVKAILDPDTLCLADDDKQIGSRVGAYRLEREIGRGGMGEVYLATRADSEFDKRVAIKLIRDGSESNLAIRRFRQER